MSLINRGLPFFLRFACVPAFSALFASLLASFRHRAALQVEILALRHQLGVLQRSVKRTKLSTTDRILWVWLSSVWNEWRTSVFIVKAATVIAWHRQGFRLFWTWKESCYFGSSGKKPLERRLGAGICLNAVTRASKICHGCSIR